MPTFYPTKHDHEDARRRDTLETRNPREQLLGILVLSLALTVAILLRSM